jgi:hypothetical protein
MNCIQSLCTALTWLNRTETLAYFGGFCLVIILLALFVRMQKMLTKLINEYKQLKWNVEKLLNYRANEYESQRDWKHSVNYELSCQKTAIENLLKKKGKK